MTARGSPGRRKRADLWNETVGEHGSRIKVGERTFGGTVYLFVYDASINGYRRESLGFRVRDADGSLIKERCTKAKRAAVDRVARRIDGELPGATATLDRVADAFRREMLPAQGAKQEVETRRELELWTNVLGAKFQLAKFSMPDWTAFVRDRATGRIDGRGVIVPHDKRRVVGNRAVAKSLKVVRHLCRFAVDHRILDADPTGGFELPVVKNPKRPVADSDRFEKLLGVARETTMFDARGEHVASYVEYLIIFAHETGRRISAVLHLRWSDWLPTQGQNGSLRWRAEHDKIGVS